MTFRAKLYDRAQATAREVIYYIEQWITSSYVVTIPVHHARLTINNTCVVLIVSFDDSECPGYLTTQTEHTATKAAMDHNVVTSTQTKLQSIANDFGTTDPVVMTNQSPSHIGAIVGGVVATVFIIVAGIVTLSAIICLPHALLKNHRTHERNSLWEKNYR